MLKSIKSRIKNLRTGADNTVIITVMKGEAIDVDSFKLDIRFQHGERQMTISGHINMRTNWVHLNSDEKEEEALAKVGINLDDIGYQIEEKSIPLNH
tara:strand:+ start:2014 stop:2304 length:291 start_codon:yes stop_codon:yes gene_type:complete